MDVRRLQENAQGMLFVELLSQGDVVVMDDSASVENGLLALA